MAQPSWRALFDSAAASNPNDLATSFAASLTTSLQGLAQEGTSLSSHAVFSGLAIGELNALLAGMDVEGPAAQPTLATLNAVTRAAPTLVSAALAQHGTIEALIRGVHKRIDLTHPLSPLVLQILHAICVRCEDALGHVDILASKEELVELIITTVMYLGTHPERLASHQGLAAANRAVQICWSLARHGTLASSKVAALFVTVDLAGRVLHLAAVLGSEQYKQDMPSPSAAGPEELRGASVGEMCVSLASTSASFAAAMLGLGGPIDASAAGLHPLRSWLLRRDHLDDMHATLSLLVQEMQGDGPLLRHLAREGQGDGAIGQLQGEAASNGKEEQGQPKGVPGTEAAGTDSEQAAAWRAAQEAPERSTAQAVEPEEQSTSVPTASSSTSPSTSATEAASVSPHEAALFSAEGAVRNLLTCLAVPLLCADPGQQAEVRALSSFALQYHYLLFQAGFVDLFGKLGNRKGPYRGAYLTFFCATSDVLLEGTRVIGEQFAAWGVRLGKDGGASDPSDDAAMFVPTSSSGTDAATAQAFITEQIKRCMDSSQRVRKVIMLSQKAAMSRQQASPSEGEAAGGPAPTSAAGPGGPAACTFCGKEASKEQRLKGCPCGVAAYCDKTCQLAHLPTHRGECKRLRSAKKEAEH